MTRDELNFILTKMGEDRWKPRLVDTSSGEYWDYDSDLMACESGVEQKQLPKDIDLKKSMFLEFDMPDDSMIDAGIMQSDSLKAKIEAPVKDGKVVLVYYNGRTNIGVYSKDKYGNAWVLPMNKRYRKIYLNDDKDSKIVGKVLELKRSEVEVDSHICYQLIDDAMKEQKKPKVVSMEHAQWVIKQLGPDIKVMRDWFSFYRPLVQYQVIRDKDYKGFCKLINETLPEHKPQPKYDEMQRLDDGCFRKPVGEWTQKSSPYPSSNRYYDYENKAKEVIEYLEREESHEDLTKPHEKTA